MQLQQREGAVIQAYATDTLLMVTVQHVFSGKSADFGCT